MKYLSKLEKYLFSYRKTVLAFFIIVTVLMGFSASELKVDAGFNKLLPLQHPYMQTFLEYNQEFGGANRVLVALMAKEGDIFNPEFFDSLKKVTDEVFFIPGVDRTRVMSLFTPNVRFTEVVEDGISGGNVIADDFQGTEEDLQQVKQNILKAVHMDLEAGNEQNARVGLALAAAVHFEPMIENRHSSRPLMATTVPHVPSGPMKM